MHPHYDLLAFAAAAQEAAPFVPRVIFLFTTFALFGPLLLVY